MKIEYKSVHLSHINYTVRFKPFKTCILGKAIAWTKRNGDNSSTIYLAKSVLPTVVAHELMHVIQNICVDRYMVFEQEREHTAYLMQYLMGQAYGYVWVDKCQ